MTILLSAKICEFAWIPRIERKLPKHCPDCGSRKWNACGDKPDFESVVLVHKRRLKEIGLDETDNNNG